MHRLIPLLLAASLSCGCATTSNKAKYPPSLTSGRTISGWGPVNRYWQMEDKVLAQCFAEMDKVDCRVFPVESVGNAKEDVLGKPSKLDIVKKKWLFCAAQAKAKGCWFAPVLFNDNAGKGNWLNGGVPLASRLPQAMAFIDWVGTQTAYKNWLIITPVAETRTDAGRALEKYAAKVLGPKGFILCNNSGSRPQGNSSWSSLFCYHPTKTSDWPKSRLGYVLSDTGAILAQLNLKNDPYGNGNPAALRPWLANGAKRGQLIVAHYGFQVSTFDKAAIAAMGMKGIK